MKLIFNRYDNGADELKSLLGFISADIRFENVFTYLKKATYQIVDIIGIETYNAITEAYHNGAPLETATAETKKIYALATHLQLPIAAFGYLRYEKKNSLSHDGNGRTVNTGENQKIAFDWMIHADNAEQRKGAYEALDILIRELDNSELEIWENSEARSNLKSLFISSISDFKKVVKTFDSRYLLMLLQSFMEDVEECDIEPVIGSELFVTLKTKIKENQLQSSDKKLLRFIQKPIAYKALIDAFRVIPIELFPDYLEIKNKSKYKQNTDSIIVFFKEKYEDHLKKLVNYVDSLKPKKTEAKTKANYEDLGFNNNDKFYSV